MIFSWPVIEFTKWAQTSAMDSPHQARLSPKFEPISSIQLPATKKSLFLLKIQSGHFISPHPVFLTIFRLFLGHVKVSYVTFNRLVLEDFLLVFAVQ